MHTHTPRRVSSSKENAHRNCPRPLTNTRTHKMSWTRTLSLIVAIFRNKWCPINALRFVISVWKFWNKRLGVASSWVLVDLRMWSLTDIRTRNPSCLNNFVCHSSLVIYVYLLAICALKYTWHSSVKRFQAPWSRHRRHSLHGRQHSTGDLLTKLTCFSANPHFP